MLLLQIIHRSQGYIPSGCIYRQCRKIKYCCKEVSRLKHLQAITILIEKSIVSVNWLPVIKYYDLHGST